MRIDLRLEGPDFRFGQQVFLFLQFLGLVDRFEDVADAVKEFGACIGEGVSFGFGGEDGADDFALVLDGKGDEVREVRREYPDKKQPVVMDVVDADSPVFANYAANRKKWYRSIGAEVVDM